MVLPHREGTHQLSSFCGQCGPIALFDKQLSHQDISRIFRCGPDFQYVFRSGDCNPHIVSWPSAEQLHSRLIFLYNPRACTRDRKCLDNASQRKGHASDARMLQGTCVLVSRKIRDTLNSIGGICAIFPLLDMMRQPWTVEYSMTARILSLLGEMLRHSVPNQESMLQSNGFCTLGYLLTEIPSDHLDSNALKALESMTEIAIHDESEILLEIYKHIFLNFHIWERTEFEVQRDMLIFLREKISSKTSYFERFLNVQNLVESTVIYQNRLELSTRHVSTTSSNDMSHSLIKTSPNSIMVAIIAVSAPCCIICFVWSHSQNITSPCKVANSIYRIDSSTAFRMPGITS